MEASDLTPTRLADLAGISVPYASQLLTGARMPSQPLAIHLYRASGWKHSSIAILTEEQISALEVMAPWVNKARKVLASC